MKIIIYSNQIQTRYIKDLLEASGVEVAQITRDLLLQWISEKFVHFPPADLALVDPQKMDAGVMLNQLGHMHIPVILMVEVGEIDWDRLLDIDGSGYLQINSGASILAARLKAILRRFEVEGNGLGSLVKSFSD
jgi:hypothetical protein